jgi:hypothetical protein
MSDEYEDYGEDEDEGSNSMVLSFSDGEAKIETKEDYEKAIENKENIIMQFMKENAKLFSEFLKNKGISEEDFNSGKAELESEDKK